MKGAYDWMDGGKYRIRRVEEGSDFNSDGVLTAVELSRDDDEAALSSSSSMSGFSREPPPYISLIAPRVAARISTERRREFRTCFNALSRLLRPANAFSNSGSGVALASRNDGLAAISAGEATWLNGID